MVTCSRELIKCEKLTFYRQTEVGNNHLWSTTVLLTAIQYLLFIYFFTFWAFFWGFNSAAIICISIYYINSKPLPNDCGLDCLKIPQQKIVSHCLFNKKRQTLPIIRTQDPNPEGTSRLLESGSFRKNENKFESLK